MSLEGTWVTLLLHYLNREVSPVPAVMTSQKKLPQGREIERPPDLQIKKDQYLFLESDENDYRRRGKHGEGTKIQHMIEEKKMIREWLRIKRMRIILTRYWRTYQIHGTIWICQRRKLMHFAFTTQNSRYN